MEAACPSVMYDGAVNELRDASAAIQFREFFDVGFPTLR
jgi:hypothetical protein